MPFERKFYFSDEFPKQTPQRHLRQRLLWEFTFSLKALPGPFASAAAAQHRAPFLKRSGAFDFAVLVRRAPHKRQQHQHPGDALSNGDGAPAQQRPEQVGKQNAHTQHANADQAAAGKVARALQHAAQHHGNAKGRVKQRKVAEKTDG